MDDPQAFERFFKEAEPVLRAVFVARFGPEDGRDVTADCLAWACSHWERLGAVGNPLGYLYRVGQSSHRRYRRRTPHLDPGAPAWDRYPDADLGPALGRLSARQREAVVLHVAMGYTLAESAELMGCSAGTIQRHVDRGMEKLRSALGGSADDRH